MKENKHIPGRRFQLVMKSAFLLAFSAILLAGCWTDISGSDSGDSLGFKVRTGVQMKTKTEYSGDTQEHDGVMIERMNWKQGDRIRIASDKASSRYDNTRKWADYQLTGDGTFAQSARYISVGTIEPVDDGKLPNNKDAANGLVWDEAGGEHQFFGLYPSPSWLDRTSKEDAEVAALPDGQKPSVAFSGGSSAAINAFLPKRQEKDDMRYAWMWAANKFTEGGTGEMNLDFYPMITTFHFTVGGSGEDGESLLINSVQLVSGSCALQGVFQATVTNPSASGGTATATYTTAAYSSTQNDTIIINLPPSTYITNSTTISFMAFVYPKGIAYDLSLQGSKFRVETGQTAITDLTLRFKVSKNGDDMALSLPLKVNIDENYTVAQATSDNININSNHFVEFPAGKKINIKNITLPVQKNPWTFNVEGYDLIEEVSDIAVNPVAITKWEEIPRPGDLDEGKPKLPLTIEPVSAAATVTISNLQDALIEWSIDGQMHSSSNRNLQIAVPAGQSVALYQADPTKRVGTITLSAPCYVYGNLMSLVAGEDFISQTALGCKYQFMDLFFEQVNLYNHDEKDIVLPATSLTEGCYTDMFFACENLTRAPALPAENLAEGCYTYMFWDCFSLTTPPELPATTLADYCYCDMFSGCRSLETAPALPAKNLTMGCYQEMFYGCTSLETAPALPAQNLAEECYKSMFVGCRSLTTVPADYLPAEKLADDCYAAMFAVTGLTTAPNLPAQDLAVRCYAGMFSGSALTTPPALPAKTLVKGCYMVMFSECENLTTLPELHAETLAEQCYSGMFARCPQLTKVPADYLPWGDLEPRCYEGMFKSCENLTTAPNLLAENLAERCYFDMFSQCTSLTTAPALPAETLARECYRNMFVGCTSLTTAPALLAKTLAEGCYGYMFQECTSLTTAPVLPATTLVTGCYVGMFWKCTSLSFIECHATNTSNNYVTCLERWTENVSSTGTFRKGRGVIWLRGTNAIPIGWTTVEL